MTYYFLTAGLQNVLLVVEELSSPTFMLSFFKICANDS